nr:AMP-binding protein [Maliibacterium massiliense]
MQLTDRFVPQTQFSSYEDFLNNFTVRVPAQFNFAYDVVDEYARLQPEKRAMLWCNEQGEERTFTFADMKRESDRAARFFTKYGIKKGDAVMVILKRRYEYWFCALALHKIGAILIPATFLLTDKDIAYRCNAASVRMILSVYEPELMDYIDKAHPDSPTLAYKVNLGPKRAGWISYDEEIAQTSADFAKPTGDALNRNDDPMLIYFTSGTTGHPKMVLHDFTYPLGHIVTAKYWQCVREDGLHLTVADTGWAKASWGKIYGQWIAGTALFVYDYDHFIPADLLEVVTRHKVTTFCAPPTIYRFMIKEDLSKYDFSALEYGAVAGEPLNPEVLYQFQRATGVTIKEGFGQTETTVLIASFPWLKVRPGSCGMPNPLYPIELLNSELQPCGVGEEGQIAIRVAEGRPVGLFKEYYRAPDKTAEAWHDGYYFTGDMAWRDEDGYLWFIGRADDVIKSSGYRIGPFEVESALVEHPAVLECAITGVPHPVRGQVVKATVVLARGYSPSEELKKELQDHVKHTTAPYKYPRIIEFVDELPKTFSGKIRRIHIRQQDAQQQDAQDE